MLLDLYVGVEGGDRLLRRVHLRHADPVGRVDHLPLQVRQIDLVVVDDPQRADASGSQIQRRGRPQASGPQQQHLGVEQLLLALDSDLRQQQMSRVAFTLLGAQRTGNLDVVAAVLPQRDPTGHRLDILIAEILDQRAGRPSRAVAGLAIENHVLRVIGRGALDPRLQIALGHVLGARDVSGRPLLRLADVDHHGAVTDLLADVGRIDLLDPALDLAENLGSGRAHG